MLGSALETGKIFHSSDFKFLLDLMSLFLFLLFRRLQIKIIFWTPVTKSSQLNRIDLLNPNLRNVTIWQTESSSIPSPESTQPANWIQQHTFSWIHSTRQLNHSFLKSQISWTHPNESTESYKLTDWIQCIEWSESNISNDLNQNPEFSRTESLLYLRFIFFKQMWLKIFL